MLVCFRCVTAVSCLPEANWLAEGVSTQAGSVTEAMLDGASYLRFPEYSWVNFIGILHQANQILVKPEVTRAGKQDGGTSALSCPYNM